jgi:transposase
MKTRKAYPTALSESKRERVVVLLPQKRTRAEQMREYMDAILYVLHSGCSWRMLPDAVLRQLDGRWRTKGYIAAYCPYPHEKDHPEIHFSYNSASG